VIRALDTNVVTRLLTNDDPEQARIAQSIVEEDFALTATVLIELECVLRSYYRWSRAMRVAGLRMLLDLPRIVEVPPLARWAVDRLEGGADFADMMHIVSAQGVDRFATFDQGITRDVGTDTPVAIETLA
jgi:predicted nucleic-acid-binding protein